MKPNLTRTLDQKISTQDHGEVRLAITVNAWLPENIDPPDDDLKAAMKQASSAVERVLFDWPQMVKPACKDCRFFQEAGSREDAECRRRPPTTIDGYGFPFVKPIDWCGEFEASPVKGL